MTRHGMESFARPITALCMGIVVVSAFGWNVIIRPDTRLPMVALGVAFLLIGTVGWIWAERRGPRMLAAWVAALLVLALLALWLSQLGVLLIAMPLIAFPVIYGSIRWGIVMTLVFLGFAVLRLAYEGYSPVDIYQGSTGFLPGAVFTIVAGQMIARERIAREQVRRYAIQAEDLATTRERNRIARDIHDSVGHYLTVVHVQIEAARAIVAANPAGAEECLVRAQELSREGLSELRRSVTLLRGGQRPFGVALAALVEDSRSTGLDTVLAVEGTARPLTPAVEFTLYRAAQEALTNVARHAQATHVQCALHYGEREVALTVTDDGIGAVATEGGFGLVGLRERVQLVGGTVAIETSAGKGFALEVRVPA